MEEALILAPGEVQKLRELGVAAYASDAQARYHAWGADREEELVDEPEEEALQDPKDEQRRKKSAAIASKIKGASAHFLCFHRL